MRTPESERPKDFVCLGCYHEQATFTQPCERCGSRRLEHIEFIRQRLGPHWRELLAAEKRMVN
jgi:hypothetical protein